MRSEQHADGERQARGVKGCSPGVRGHCWGTPGAHSPFTPGMLAPAQGHIQQQQGGISP